MELGLTPKDMEGVPSPETYILFIHEREIYNY